MTESWCMLGPVILFARSRCTAWWSYSGFGPTNEWISPLTCGNRNTSPSGEPVGHVSSNGVPTSR